MPAGNEVEYWKYSYDSQNQLTTVWKNGTANANIIARFAYDYAGKRLKAVEGNTVTHYLYGFTGQLLSEVKYTTTASDPLKATGTDLQQSKVTSYVYAMGHQLAKMDGSIAGGSKYYYHNDNLGSTMMMTKKVDDATRQNPIVFMQDYTPFGQNLHQPGEPAATNETEATLKFTGQVEDADIGLCYYNARYYDPEIGRFTQEDSFEGDIFDPQTLNLYIYALNNPLRYIDPTGHTAENKNYQVDNNSDWQLMWSFEYVDDQWGVNLERCIYINSQGQLLFSEIIRTTDSTTIVNKYMRNGGELDHQERKVFQDGKEFFFDETKLAADTHHKWANNLESFLSNYSPVFNMVRLVLEKPY